MMVFSMMPTVIAVPVMDSVESAEVEPADVPEETEAEQEVALAADPVYATKPAQYDAEKGILVLFDNGNAADAVNLTNATLDGLQKEKFNAPESPEDPVDGYYVQNMMVDLPYQTDGTYQLVGLYTGNANTTIGYADKAMNGTLGFYVDYYSSDKAANGKNMCRAIAAGTLPAQPWGVAPKSNARNFGYVYSDRNNDIAISAGWQTPKNEIKVFDTLNFVGLVFAEGPAQYGKISRTYAYFMPTNNVKLYEGDTLIEIKDLGEATSWTATAPTGTNNAWVDASGTYYVEGDTVPAGATLTATTVSFVYASKPAQYDAEKGILVFFDNGNAADAVNDTNATFVGGMGAVVTDGYFARLMMNPNALGAGVNSTVKTLGLYTGNADTAIEYKDGKSMSAGKLIFVADGYSNGSDTEFNRSAITKTPEVNPWGKDAALENNGAGAYTDWSRILFAADTWTETGSEIVNMDGISFVGFARGDAHAQKCSFRKAYAYYMPSSHVMLYEGENLIKIIDINGTDGWTVEAPENTEYNAWVDGNGKVYNAGDVAPHGKLTATKISYAEKPAQYDATRGILVFFDNGNATDAENLTNAKLVGYTGTAVADGYHAWDMNKAEAFQASAEHRAFGLYTGDPDAEVTYTTIGYADGSAMNGKLIFLAETYSNHDVESNMYRGAVNNRDDVNTWGTDKDEFYGTVRTDWGFGAVIPSCDWGIAENNITICDTLSFVGLYRQASASNRYRFRSVYMYYMPTNNVKLYVNGTLSEIIDLGTATEWTVVAPADTNLVWTDAEGNLYGAGDKAPAGTVLSTMEKAPYSIQKTSIRTTDPNGIRFAGFVTNAMKNVVDEYGFVIARKNIIPNVEDVVFGAENTVHGIAYAKGTNRDIVYIDASESTEEAKRLFGENAFDVNGWYFTGVLKGVPMEASALQEDLVARTYYKIGDKYYYGDAIFDSIYKVAERVRDSYQEIPEYIQQVIDIVETPAAE